MPLLPKLRVVYPRYHPHVSSKCSPFPPLGVTQKCEFPGLMVEIIHLIAQELRMQIDPIVLNEHGGTLDTENMNDALNCIRNNSADTIALGVQSTLSRKVDFSFSDTLYKSQTKFIMQNTEKYNSMWSFFFIFDSRTWLTILTALAMQCCLCVMIRQMEVYVYNARPIGIFESAWQMLRLQLLQPEKIYFNSKAGKLSIIFFSLIQCAVLLGVFSSWILSNILRPSEMMPVDSVEHIIEKIANREYYLVTSNLGYWFYEEIEKSQEFPYPELRNALQYNHVRITDSVEQTLNHVLSGHGMSFVQDDARTYFRSMEHCGLSELTNDLVIVKSTLMFAKNNTLINDVNRVINENQMLILRIARKYLYTLRSMKIANCNTKQKAIGIKPYFGVCLISLFIIFIASIIFLGEIATGYNARVQREQLLNRRRHSNK